MMCFGARARFVAVVVAVVVAATGAASSAGEEEERSSAAGKEMVQDPATGKLTTKPEYGGVLVYVCGTTPPTGKWWEQGLQDCNLISGVLEKLGILNWAKERDDDDLYLRAPFVPPGDLRGALVKSWEWRDPLTLVLYLRNDVHWQDKPPVNGRGLTAEDVATYFRYLIGLDNNESHCRDEPLCAVDIATIDHTENPTVIFEMNQPSLFALQAILDSSQAFIYPPELIAQYGDSVDWRNLVGTGPFMLTDYDQATSSITWTRNPDYWGFDEKYSENSLPYVDELSAVIIREEATRLAALRTGRVDYIGPAGGAPIRLDTGDSLMKTNPELEFWEVWVRSDHAYGMNVNNAPFDDIRVRTALQMALDLETINDSLFKGRANWIPHGQTGDSLEGYYIPFDEWPDAVKQGYRHDPTGAEERLDEAGYPRGPDGIRFKTILNQPEGIALEYAEIAARYWRDVGVDVEIQVVDRVQYFEMARESSQQGLFWTTAGAHYFLEFLATRWDGEASFNPAAVDDSVMNAMIDALRDARRLGEVDEYQTLFRTIDMYAIERHWVVWGPDVPIVHVTQPWLKGYNGEYHLGYNNTNALFARLWIDQDLKNEMGY